MSYMPKQTYKVLALIMLCSIRIHLVAAPLAEGKARFLGLQLHRLQPAGPSGLLESNCPWQLR